MEKSHTDLLSRYISDEDEEDEEGDDDDEEYDEEADPEDEENGVKRKQLASDPCNG